VIDLGIDLKSEKRTRVAAVGRRTRRRKKRRRRRRIARTETRIAIETEAGEIETEATMSTNPVVTNIRSERLV
jgi:hypothetical protein